MLFFQHFGPLGISTTNLTTGPLSVIQQSCSAHNNRLMEMVYGSTFSLKKLYFRSKGRPDYQTIFSVPR